MPRIKFDLRMALSLIGLSLAAGALTVGIWATWDGTSYLFYPTSTGIERMFEAIVAILRAGFGIILTAFSIFIGFVITYDWHFARSKDIPSETSETTQ